MKLAGNQRRWRLDGPIVWTLELVWRLEASEDKIAYIVDHWLDLIVGGFVIEFVVNTSVSYCEVEHRLFKGSQDKYLRSLNNWMKMLLCEKRIMKLP